MRKICLIISLISVYYLSTFSQEVISSSGDYYENTSISLSWTIGELMTETLTNGTNILTQGFHQSNMTSISIFEREEIDINVKIAPNPTPDLIKLYIDNYKNINYQLFDFNGKLIKQSDVLSEETEISFMHLANATYFLKISKGDQLIKTFQVIKQ